MGVKSNSSVETRNRSEMKIKQVPKVKETGRRKGLRKEENLHMQK